MTDDIRREADARHLRHVEHPTHRPLSDDYEFVGLCGEDALAAFVGGVVDLTPRSNGDDGKDVTGYFRDGAGATIAVPIDVKTFRKPFNLIVEQGKVRRAAIYVLASFDDQSQIAKLLGWEWGSVLAAQPMKDFGKGVVNHFIPKERLRPMSDLAERLVFHGKCACGAPGLYVRFEGSVKTGKRIWSCHEHRPR